MSKIVEIINNLPDLLPLKPATDIDIKDAEIQLRVSFNEEYREYLLAFGAIMADGIELTGIAKSAHRNVVNQTKQERELNPKIPNNMYVVENTGVDGIVIWQETNGGIYQSSPNVEPKKVADSLLEYLSKRI